jgi:hypothetical protein
MMMQVGVGAVSYGTPRGLARVAGLGATGLGIPGPWGQNPSGIDAGTYEITGTQVYLRKTAGTSGETIGTFNPTESSPNIIAGTPDTVDFAGTSAQDATATANGLTWAFVSVKTGPLAGQKGFVAMEYMGPVGWTASHNGTGPAPKNQPAPPDVTPPATTAAAKSSAIPWIIGGLVLAGLVVGGAVMGKKHHARRKAHHASPAHHAPAHAHEARRRRRRYR